jgi:hypothetical protein
MARFLIVDLDTQDQRLLDEGPGIEAWNNAFEPNQTNEGKGTE